MPVAMKGIVKLEMEGNMRSLYEVVIVGAGPAGCSGAIHLKRLGIDVLLLDKAAFPRDKICGDGIPSKAFPLLEELGIEMDEFLSKGYQVHQTRMYSPEFNVVSYGSADHGSAAKSMCLPRKDFDSWLFERAIEIVGQVQTEAEVVKISKKSKDEHTLLVRNSNTASFYEIATKMIIGADGVYSCIAREGNLVPANNEHRFDGLRAYFRNHHFDPVIHIFYDKLTLPGYAWVFPVSSTVANVGMIVTRNNRQRTGKNARSIFKELQTNHPVLNELLKRASMISDMRDRALKLGSLKGPRTDDGIVLVGDAASFINPLTGGGIFNALLSAKQAAIIVADCLKKRDTLEKALLCYENWWKETLGPSFYYSSLMKRFLENERRANWWFSRCSQHRTLANFFLSIYGNPVSRLFFLNPLYWLKLALMK